MERKDKELEHLKANAILLQNAINTGDQLRAQELAITLATYKGIKLHIQVLEKEMKLNAQDPEFSIKVYVEDREASGGVVNLKVRASNTVGDLKAKMLLKNKFPLEVQRWVIGKKIRKDTETLRSCNIKGPNPPQTASVFLYLMSAKSVGLDKENFELAQARVLLGKQDDARDRTTEMEDNLYNMEGPRVGPSTLPANAEYGQLNRQRSSASQSSQGSIHSMVPGMAAGGVAQAEQQPVLVENPELVQFTAGPVKVKPRPNLAEITPQTFAAQSFLRTNRTPIVHPEEDQVEIGWECPKCTFVNKPTRPGCTMCAAPRPADYRIPEGYVMDDDERQWMENQKQLDAQTRQANPEMEGRGIDLTNMPQRELDALLRFNDALQEALTEQQLQERQQQQQQFQNIQNQPVPPRYAIPAQQVVGLNVEPRQIEPDSDTD